MKMRKISTAPVVLNDLKWGHLGSSWGGTHVRLRIRKHCANWVSAAVICNIHLRGYSGNYLLYRRETPVGAQDSWDELIIVYSPNVVQTEYRQDNCLSRYSGKRGQIWVDGHIIGNYSWVSTIYKHCLLLATNDQELSRGELKTSWYLLPGGLETIVTIYP
jgi:hypothetical protein